MNIHFRNPAVATPVAIRHARTELDRRPSSRTGTGRVLAAIDFSESSRPLLRQAAALARETGERLTLIYVQPQDWIEEDASNPLVADAYRDLGEEVLTRLNRLAEEEVEGDVKLNAEFRVGNWARTLAAAAKREDTSLVVVAGESRRGLLDLLRLTPTQRLVRESPCPVEILPEQLLTAKPQRPPLVRQIVVVAGLSESSRRAVKHAAQLALRLKVRLVALHVLSDRTWGSRLNAGGALKLQKQTRDIVRRKLLGWLIPEMAAGLEARVLVRSGFPTARVIERHLSVLNPERVVFGASFDRPGGGRHIRAALRKTSVPVVFVGPACADELPVFNAPARAGAGALSATALPPAAKSRHKRILIVDDDPSVRESLDKLFKGEQCEVTLAADGQEVIGKVDPAAYDLVLLDLKMSGKNGWVTLRHLHSIAPQLPVVVITGLPNRQKLAASAGVNALVEKPLDVPKLLETARRLMDESNARAVSEEILSSSNRFRGEMMKRYSTPYSACWE